MTPPQHGINRHPLKYLVFAGNIREYKQWERERAIPYGESMFVAHSTNLHGISTENAEALTYIIVGTFHLRPDAQEIMAAARAVRPEASFFVDSPHSST